MNATTNATETLLTFLAGDRPWLTQARCNSDAAMGVFHHPAHDFDGTDFTAFCGDDGEELTVAQMRATKTRVTNEALALCAQCPVMSQCREWTLNNEVAGVSGGLTEQQRDKLAASARAAREQQQEQEQEPARVFQANWTGQKVNDELVAELTMRGWPSSRIATELGADQRTVHRARARARRNGLLTEACPA